MRNAKRSEVRGLRLLMLLRALLALLVMVLIASFHDQLLLMDPRVPALFYILMPLLLPIQWLLQEQLDWPLSSRATVGFIIDITLIVILVAATGGLLSPFSLLFALVLIASASFCHRTAILLLTVMAAAGFVLSSYATAWWLHLAMAPLSPLRILFQVSVLFLVGGVMAAIVARHERLHAAQQQSEQNRQQIQGRYEQILQQMHDSMLLVDGDGMVVDANSAAHRQVLTDRKLPLALASLLPDDVLDSGQRECGLEGRRWLVSSTKLDDGMRMVMLLDISDVYALREQLLAQEKLAALGQMAAQLAHEVRNPLQTIAQGVDLFEHATPEMLLQLKGAIQQEVARLNRLVRSMLEYATPLEPNSSECTPCGLLQASLVQSGLEQAAESTDSAKDTMPSFLRWIPSRVGVTRELHGDVTIELRCDVTQCHMDGDNFRLVVDNLVRNALAHAPSGSVVALSMRAVAKDGWCLTVSDHGEGIAADLREHLFEPFVSGRRGSGGGTGLGLAIVRQACDANGWGLEVKSVTEGEDHGTCFTVLSSPMA
ncbi:MAG: PAS domain-containing sensor histidine kinase [Mariprofundales bacterium]